MSVVTYRLTWDPVGGSNGYTVEYRAEGDTVYTTPSTSPNPTLNTYYDLVLESNTTYTIRLVSNGTLCTAKPRYFTFSTISGNCCSDGYTLSPDESYCYQILLTAPTIIQSDICLAVSQLVTQYSSAGSRLYAPGYSTTLSGTYTALATQPQWKETTGQVTGPMNREAVWVDTDCNGTKDPLTAGQVLQLTIQIYTATAKTVYVGIGGDNTFRLDVNGTTIVDRNATFAGDNFNYWHVFPVNISSGTSYFNFRAVGDGTTNDAFAAVIYNNTQAELVAATLDSQLDILFRTSDYIGVHIDIATCPTNYFLDTTGGQGNYECTRVLNASPIECGTTGTFEVSAAFNYSIDSVTGTGLPTLPLPTGLNNTVTTSFAGTIGMQTLSVDISGTNMATTKLVLYVDNIEQDCVNMSGAGTYLLDLPAVSALSTVLISINAGTC